LIGGLGSDRLVGGTGNDIFIFKENEAVVDTISDFTSGEDVINMNALSVPDFADIIQTDQGGDLALTVVGLDLTIVLSGLAGTVLSESDFDL
jgi:Ca2+-binding RTX toxin-like protein